MHRLMDSVVVETDGDGTTITLRRQLPPRQLLH
jgi:hypothetical protein